MYRRRRPGGEKGANVFDVNERDLGYRLFFEAGSKGMLIADGDGTVMDANPAACRLLERPREEMASLGLNDLSDPSYPILGAASEEMRATGSFYVTARLLRRDGSSFPAEASVVDDGEEGLGVVFKLPTLQPRGGSLYGSRPSSAQAPLARPGCTRSGRLP